MILQQSDAWSLDFKWKQGFPFGFDLADRLTLWRPSIMYGSTGPLYHCSRNCSKEHIIPSISSTYSMMLNAPHIHVQASGHVHPQSRALIRKLMPLNISWNSRNASIPPSATERQLPLHPRVALRAINARVPAEVWCCWTKASGIHCW